MVAFRSFRVLFVLFVPFWGLSHSLACARGPSNDWPRPPDLIFRISGFEFRISALINGRLMNAPSFIGDDARKGAV